MRFERTLLARPTRRDGPHGGGVHTFSRDDGFNREVVALLGRIAHQHAFVRGVFVEAPGRR